MIYFCERRMLMVKINTEYITLGQLLKMTNVINSGAEAKFAVKELRILVNGEKEDRRGRKLYPGDIVNVEKQTFKVEK
jgi:ribosome-associated protein